MADSPQRFGPYLLLEPLGQGAMGDVHLARPFDAKSTMPTPLVIKRLHDTLAAGEIFINRFMHEASVAAAIDSPNVVKVYDVGKVDEKLYLALEYVQGWTMERILDNLRATNESISLATVGELAAGMLEGLCALHEAKDSKGGSLGIVHRDISPRNVMLGQDGRVRLIDLGLGKSNMREWQTRAGTILGSPGYMSPEQAMSGVIDQRSDIFAVGSLLYELLTLDRLIQKGPLARMLRDTLADPRRNPSAIRRELTPEVDAMVLKALAPAPELRFASAREFLETVRAVLPSRQDVSTMHSLVGDMLWGELSQAKTEVARLLAKSDSYVSMVDSSATAPNDVALDPTTLRTPAVIAQPPAQPQVVALARVATNKPAKPAARPMAEVQPISAVSAPRPFISTRTLLIVFIVALPLAVLFGQQIERWRTTPQPAPTVEATKTGEAPRAMSRPAQAAPAVEAVPIAERVEPAAEEPPSRPAAEPRRPTRSVPAQSAGGRKAQPAQPAEPKVEAPPPPLAEPKDTKPAEVPDSEDRQKRIRSRATAMLQRYQGNNAKTDATKDVLERLLDLRLNAKVSAESLSELERALDKIER